VWECARWRRAGRQSGARGCPTILEHENRRGRARVQGGAGLLQVVVGEQPRRRTLEHLQLCDLLADVGDLQAGDRTIVGLGHEGKVEDADDPAIDQVDQEGRDLAVGVGVRPGDEHVVDRAHLFELVQGHGHSFLE
jgi:hypothetical protein